MYRKVGRRRKKASKFSVMRPGTSSSLLPLLVLFLSFYVLAASKKGGAEERGEGGDGVKMPIAVWMCTPLLFCRRFGWVDACVRACILFFHLGVGMAFIRAPLTRRLGHAFIPFYPLKMRKQ